MGIDYSGGIIVGVYGSEIEVEDLNEFIEEHELDYMSPYFDAGLEDCVVGVKVSSEVELEDLDGFMQEVLEAKDVLNKLGIEHPVLKGMQHIW